MMMRKWTVALIFVALLYAGALRAQVGPGPASDDAKRERVQQLILMRLNSSLGLNSEQSQKLGEILRKYHQQKTGLRAEMRDLTGQLQTAYNSNNEAEIRRIVAQLTAIHSQMENIDNQIFSDLKPMLTPKQQAQYFLIMDEIRREVQSVRQNGGPPGLGAPGPGGPTRVDMVPTRGVQPY
jgi:DNA anti-recombination protein RmuC